MIMYKGLDTTGPNGLGRACVWINTSQRYPDGGPFYLPDLLSNRCGLNWGSTEICGRKVPRQGCDGLAFTLCSSIVDEPEARRLYKLFQHRHVNAMPDGRWTLTHSQVRAWVQAIQRDIVDNARAIRQAPTERLEIQRETGIGANGVPVRWDTDDDGKIIPAHDPDDMTWSPAPYRRGA